MSSVQIIGSSCAVPNSDAATSAYLHRSEESTILIECGHGAVAKLRHYADIRDLTAVVITHMHPDHCWDLVALRNYIYVHGLPKIPLYLPSNGATALRRMEEAFDQPSDYFDRTFIRRPYGPDEDFSIGKTQFSALRTRHNIEANALSVVDETGRRLVFTSDTAWFPGLVDFARGCDLLLAEVTELDSSSADPDWHLSPRTVGRLVTAAQPGLTLLTHYREEYAADILSGVTQLCNGHDVRLAIEGESHGIGG